MTPPAPLLPYCKRRTILNVPYRLRLFSLDFLLSVTICDSKVKEAMYFQQTSVILWVLVFFWLLGVWFLISGFTQFGTFVSIFVLNVSVFARKSRPRPYIAKYKYIKQMLT